METIEKFVKKVLEEVTGENINDNKMLLLDEELLDSMSILYLVSEIEDKYGIQIPVEEVVEENFRNIEAVVKYVTKKCSGSLRG